jgi:hypothetical protein
MRVPWTGGADSVPADVLWRRGHMTKAAVLIALGTVLWFVGAYQVAGRATLERQAGPMDLAIIGLIVAGAGQVSWIADGRRRIGLRRRALIGVGPQHRAASREPKSAVVASSELATCFASADTKLFHRADCRMGEGREWSGAARSAHVAAGRTPCGVCKP